MSSSDLSRARLIRRQRDLGWLALSPPDSSLQIGVTAATEQAARSKLAEALRAWARSEPAYEWPVVPHGH